MTYTFKLSRRLAIAFPMVLLAALSCGETTEPTTNVTASDIVALVIKPEAATIRVRDSVNLYAYGVTSSGDSVEVTVSWSTTDSTTTTTKGRGKGNGNGQVRGNKAGQTKVIAEDSSGVSDTVIVTVADSSVTQVTVNPASSALMIGGSVQLAATLRDSAGNLRSGSVSWTSSDIAVATVDSGGLATGRAVGAVTITAAGNGEVGTASVTVSQSLPVAVRLVKAAGDGQASAAGTALAESLVVRVLDGSGNGIGGQSVSWTPAPGSGLASPTTVTTDAGGFARTRWSLGSTIGIETMNVGSGSLTAAFTSQAVATSTGTGVAQGVVSGPSGPVGGGVLMLLSGSTVVATVPVSTTGSYQITGVAAGTFALRLEPNHAYSIAAGEPDPKPLTLQSGQTATVDFRVQPAVFYDDFQGYANTSELLGPQGGGSATSGFGFSAVYNTTGAQAPLTLGGSNGNITLTNDGPNGSRVMRYDFPDRTAVGCTSNGYKLQRRVHFDIKPSSSTYYIRWKEKALTGWVNGISGCGTIEYKHHLGWIDQSSGGTQEWGLLLYGNPPGQENMVGQGWMNALDSPTTRWPWTDGAGDWHTWMLVVRNLNTTSVVFELWYDGRLVNTMKPPSGGTLSGTNRLNFVELGANINTGNPPMTKLWREYGVYQTRPALVP